MRQAEQGQPRPATTHELMIRTTQQPGQAQQARGRHPPTPVRRKPLPATSMPLSAPRCGLAWCASLPRPASTETVPPFADFTERAAVQAPQRPILEGPGAGPPSPWLGSAPEATPRTRTRAGRPLRPGSIVEVRGRHLGFATRIKNGMASRPLRLHGPAPHPVGLRCQAAHDVAPSLARGHAERRRSGACPQQALILDPYPLAPRRAGSAAHAPNPNTQTPRQLRRTDHLQVGASWPGNLVQSGLGR
jgi:hypothetical protein